MRRLIIVLAAGAAWACASSLAEANPPQIQAVCVGAPSCNNWFRGDVHLRWDITDGTVVAGCKEEWITIDTPPDGLYRTCTAQDPVPPNNNAFAEVRIFRDTVPPNVTGAVPTRPPDHAGWYTHAITFAAQGSDSTSGLLSCDSVDYRGPDAANATIVAGCRDKAGNSASRAFPLSYDATPPDPSGAAIKTGDRIVRLSWPAGATATVMRTPGTDGASSSVLYQGAGTGFTDQAVRNRRQYRYVLTLTDAAGNSASRELPATPQRQLLTPDRRALVAAPPLLRWTRVRDATYYNVQLFRNGRKILSAWPKRPQLQLREKWRFRGRRHRLVDGRYQWYVWPGVGPRSARKYGERIGARSFVLDRR
jgi:hypothetical protein